MESSLKILFGGVSRQRTFGTAPSNSFHTTPWGRSIPLILLKPVADPKLDTAWVKGSYGIPEIRGGIVDLECAEVVEIQEIKSIQADFQGIAAAEIELLCQVEIEAFVPEFESFRAPVEWLAAQEIVVGIAIAIFIFTCNCVERYGAGQGGNTTEADIPGQGINPA